MVNWLTGWGYRKSHLITASAGAGTNYQRMIKVYKTTGTDGTEVINGVTAGKVYVGSKCRDDFGDIRFTDNDGSTELDYWQDPDYLVSGTSSVFWVEVKDTLESNATIYVYYNNSGQTTTSNGDNTFLLYDHFDDTSLDAAKWSEVEIGGGLVSEPVGTAVLLDVHPNVSNDKAGIKSVATFTSNIAFLVKRKQTAEHGYYIVMALGAGGTCGSAVMDALKSGYQWRQYEPANTTATNGLYEYAADGTESVVAKGATINGDNDAYHIYEARYYGATGILDFLLDGVSKKSGTDTTFLADSKNFLVSQGSYSAGAYGQDTYVDYVIVRKFIASEPAHSTWGEEEEEVTTKTVTYDIDVLLQKLGITEGYDIDVLIKKLGLTKDYLIDIIFQKLGIETYSLDTVFLGTITSAYDLDVLFKKLGISKNYSIDVLLQKLGITTYSIDVLFNKLGIEKTYDIDVLLQKLGLEKTYSIDAMLQKLAITKTYSIDILFKKLGIELNYSIDTILEKLGIEKPYDIDTIIKRLSVENPYSIDTILKKLEITKDYSIDVSFLGTVSKSYDLDTVIKKLGIPANYLVDVVISTFKTLEEPYSIDVLFLKTIDKLYSIDVVIILPTEKTYTIDTLLKKLDIPLSYAIDALFKKLDASLTYQIDLALRKLGLIAPYNIDVMFQKLGLPKTYNIDVILQKLGVEVPYSVDSIFERQDISKQYLVDVLFGILPTILSYSIDAIFKKYGATQGYSIDVILKALGIPIPTYISRRKMEIFYSFAFQLPIIGALSLKFENIPIDLVGDLHLFFNWNILLQGEIFKDLDFQIPIIGDIVKTFEMPLKVLGDTIHNFEVELEMLGVFSEQEKNRRKQIDKVKRIRDLLT